MVVKVLTATIAAWIAVLPMLLLQPSTGSQTLPHSATEPGTNNVATASNSDSALAALEQSVLKQVNQYRADRGLAPLALDPELCRQAQLHSQTMATGRSMNHDGFAQRMANVTQSYQNASENVAYNHGYPDPDQQAVDNWIDSPEHRQNIEGEFNLTGIGITRNAEGEYYFTQIFVLRR